MTPVPILLPGIGQKKKYTKIFYIHFFFVCLFRDIKKIQTVKQKSKR